MQHTSIATSLLAAVSLSGLSATGLAEPAATTAETYLIVDHRIASMVAATLEAQESAGHQAELGLMVRYGDALVWHDGRTCEDWQAVEGLGPDFIAEDPNLADLQASFGGGTPVNIPVSLICDGAMFAEIVRLDDRVQIGFAPNGTIYLVMERIPGVDEATAIQHALNERGFYDGPYDGVMNDQTRDGVADFIAAQGVLRPRVGILTDAVVEALLGE